jgi:hypothetical protein
MEPRRGGVDLRDQTRIDICRAHYEIAVQERV